MREGVPSHMHLDHATRQLFIADTGANRILVVNPDSGKYLRDARAEYTQFSSQLPSFQYSIWGCTEFYEFAKVESPSGLVVTQDKVFVAEFETGKIHAFSKAGVLLETFETPALVGGLYSLALSPDKQTLWFSHSSNKVGYISLKDSKCPSIPTSSTKFTPPTGTVSLSATPQAQCTAEAARSVALPPVIEHEAGYMNMDAITDDYVDKECKEMNYDALLLAGYFCHRCLPGRCQKGGVCKNIRYVGFTCDCNTDPSSPFGFYGDTCQHKVPKKSAGKPCQDLTMSDGSPWHDSGGPEYNCQGHYQRNPAKCMEEGHMYANAGHSATTACCACGGGLVDGLSTRDICRGHLKVFCGANDLKQCDHLAELMCPA
jgi:hypothetical protein